MTQGGRSQVDDSPRAGQDTHAEGVRPLLVALAESQAVPLVIYGPGGDIMAASSSLGHLLHPERRLVAHDGTDLWTIVAGRANEARPALDLRMRLRTPEGDIGESALLVVPLRGSDGALGGAAVFVLVVPTAGRAPEADIYRGPLHDSASPAGIDDMVGYLARLVGAACAYVAEVEHDDVHDLCVLASHSCFPDAAHTARPPESLPVPLAGRDVVVVPDGLAEMCPDEPWVASGGYRAYVAVPLADAAGRQIGVLGAAWREPLSDVAGTSAVFKIVGARIAGILADMVAERELKESEQRYGAVFEGSAVPILLVEPSTTQIVDANPAACAFYGFARDEMLTMSVLQVDALTPEALRSEMRLAVEGARERFPGRHRRGDGSTREVDVHTGKIAVGGRQLLYFMVYDMTDRRRMELELERHQRELEHTVAQRTEDLLRANVELQHATVTRDMMLANLAQEMRTSLQTITGFSTLMIDGLAGELSDEQARQLEMVRDAGRRLTTFVAGLLEHQRAEMAESECEPEAFDIVALVESVVFGLGSFAEDKGLFMKVVADERPVDVFTDRYKVQQVVLNLISNAVRHTERGGVTVRVSRVDGDATDVAVVDTGPGITEDVVAALDATGDEGVGAVTGLPATRRAAGSIGGSISVASEAGKGSIFTLRLPNSCLEAEAR